MKNIVLSLFLLFSAAMSAQQVPDGPFLDLLLTANGTNNVAKDSAGNPIAVDANYNNIVTAAEAAQVYALNVSSSGLTSLEGIEFFTNLTFLDCQGNLLTSLDLIALTNLEELYCYENVLTSLDVTGLAALDVLECYENSLTSLDVSGLGQLVELNCSYNSISTFDTTGCNSLQTLICNYNAFTSLDVSGLETLVTLNCATNNISTLDLSALINLSVLRCSDNDLVTLDLNANTNLTSLSCSANPLETLFMKNGMNEAFSGDEPWIETALIYICADAFQIASLEAAAPDTVEINSFCSYEPGGIYNTITGHVVYDADNNGCSGLDFTAPSVKIKISDGAFEDTVFSDADGNYTFYVGQVGDYTITPVFENDYFTFAEQIVTIAAIDGTSVTQDLCVAPNGVHSDIEVVIAPVTTAQPGFDAVYKMVYKNKGTQFLSGEVTCGWDSSVLSFVNAEPYFNDFGPNTYTWYYDNLQPFEIREIYMTLEVNAPGDTPPVNVGDTLPFTITGTPGADANPEDNFFAFDQEVVGSYDPNNIVCIEGEMEAPDAIGEYLHYIVNFENTGTAPTSFVVVTYELDPDDFDVDTVQLIDSSHEVQVRAQGNSFEFMFDNLTLGVADHGNILFKVKSKGSLMAGDEVASQANIYFDYNFPVLTNEAVTTYAILGTDDFEADNTIKMYPNPVKDAVTIAGDHDLTTIELYDIQGRLLQTAIVNSTTATIDMAKRAAGVYFIKAASGKGVKVEKLVKE